MADITELFEFNDNGTYYTYCQSIMPIIFNGKTYAPSLISRDRINLGDNILKNTLTINLPRTNEFGRSLLVNMPETPILFTLYRNETKFWQGRVLSAEGAGLFIKLSCVSAYSKATRPGITARIQITCRHMLYSQDCGAIKDNFTVAATINTISSNGIDITVLPLAQPSNYFLNGEMVFGTERRRIIKHNGNNLKIIYPFKIPLTGSVLLNPGCDHTEPTCTAKFNNGINYGGASKLPLKD